MGKAEQLVNYCQATVYSLTSVSCYCCYHAENTIRPKTPPVSISDIPKSGEVSQCFVFLKKSQSL